MPAAISCDVLIRNGDMVVDEAAIPRMVYGPDCVLQDMHHMICATGLLRLLIAERDRGRRMQCLQRLEREIEVDERIVPGSVVITPEKGNSGTVLIKALTTEGTMSSTAISTTVSPGNV